MTFDPTRFVIRREQDDIQDDVILVCLDCGQPVVAEIGSPALPPAENALDRIIFLADDHKNLYCTTTTPKGSS